MGARAQAKMAAILAGLLAASAACPVLSDDRVDQEGPARTAEDRFTFAFQDMPLAKALALLAVRSGHHIALQGPGQQTPITARFESANFEEALRKILESRPHLVVRASERNLEIQLLEAPPTEAVKPVGLDLQPRASEEIGLFPPEDAVLSPEKPEGIGFRPGGLSIGPEDDGAQGPSPAEKAPPVEDGGLD